jgi:hypothetical protein
MTTTSGDKRSEEQRISSSTMIDDANGKVDFDANGKVNYESSPSSSVSKCHDRKLNDMNRNDLNGGNQIQPVSTEKDRIQLINQSISYSGTLRFKDTLLQPATNSSSHIVDSKKESRSLNSDDEDDYKPESITWLNRFIVLRSGFLSFYSNLEDLYDDEKEPIHEICIANILVVESSSDERFTKDLNNHSNEDNNINDQNRIMHNGNTLKNVPTPLGEGSLYIFIYIYI